jgi:hypothetical protein
MFKFIVSLLAVLLSLSINAKNLAIIIGNDAYQNVGKLDNPIRDANLLAKQFEAIGYETRLKTNLDEFNFNKLLKSIARESSGYDATVIYYAGHAVQLGGLNYMLATDQLPPKTEEDIKLSAVLMDDLIQSIKSPIKIVLMDACRDNPLIQQTLSATSRGILSRGLAPPSRTSGGLFVAYATASGNVAGDGVKDANSPFARALANNLSRPESIDDMFSRVTKEVLEKTKNEQRPFKYASLEDKFCLPGPCKDLLANYSPSQAIEKQIKKIDKVVDKYLYTAEVIDVQHNNLVFFNDWVTFNKTDNDVWAFNPTSFQYNTKTQLVKYEERRTDKVTGLASIFSVNGTFTITSTIMDCAKKKFTYDRVTDYDRNGEITQSFSVQPHQIKWTDIGKGTISESAYLNFCGENSIALNLVPGTVKSNLSFLSTDESGTYYWGDKGKVVYNDKKFYGVLYEYTNTIRDDFIESNVVAQIIVATADCSDKSKANQIKTFFIDEKRKIVGMAHEDRLITLLPNSGGRIVLESDCEGQPIKTNITSNVANNSNESNYSVPIDVSRESLEKMSHKQNLKFCHDARNAMTLPMKIDNITTLKSFTCGVFDQRVTGLYAYYLDGGQVNPEAIKKQWEPQKNAWCTNPDQYATLKMMDVEFYYSDTSGKFINKNSFTLKDCE